MNLELHLEKAREAVLEAGRIILDIQRSGKLETKVKADGSFVTRADVDAEQRIREILKAEFPDYGFEGEELGRVLGVSLFKWCCDPLDGTHAYINHEKMVCTSLALLYDNRVILAAIYNPFTKELYSGGEGLETNLNGIKLPRLSREEPENSVVNFHITKNKVEDIGILYDLWKKRRIGKLVSNSGSAAYNLAQVAEGLHSCYIARTRKPPGAWDIAAGIYLVRSIGGKVTGLDGKDYEICETPGIIIASTNNRIHEKILDTLVEASFAVKETSA